MSEHRPIHIFIILDKHLRRWRAKYLLQVMVQYDTSIVGRFDREAISRKRQPVNPPQMVFHGSYDQNIIGLHMVLLS